MIECSCQCQCSCHVAPAAPRCAAAGAWNYTSPITNDTYVFNSTAVNQADAQSSCKVAGGHLVAWSSVEEQVGPGAWLALALQSSPCVLPV